MESTELLDQLLKHSLAIEKEMLELQDKMRKEQLLYEASLKEYTLDLLRDDTLDCDPLLTLVEQHQATIPSQQLLLDKLAEHTTLSYETIMKDIHHYSSMHIQQSHST